MSQVNDLRRHVRCLGISSRIGLRHPICRSKLYRRRTNEQPVVSGGWDDVLGSGWNAQLIQTANNNETSAATTNNFGSLICQSIDGEVMSFQKMEKQAITTTTTE